MLIKLKARFVCEENWSEVNVLCSVSLVIGGG